MISLAISILLLIFLLFAIFIEGVNFASERWISFGNNARPCLCSPYSVRINMDSFCDKLKAKKAEKRSRKRKLEAEKREKDLAAVTRGLTKRHRKSNLRASTLCKLLKRVEQMHKRKQNPSDPCGVALDKMMGKGGLERRDGEKEDLLNYTIADVLLTIPSRKRKGN